MLKSKTKCNYTVAGEYQTHEPLNARSLENSLSDEEKRSQMASVLGSKLGTQIQDNMHYTEAFLYLC